MRNKKWVRLLALVRGLFLSRLTMPGGSLAVALVMFCGRYLEILLHECSIQMCRVSMAETERFPEQAAQYFDVLFTQVHAHQSAYLKTTFGLSACASAEAAHTLLGLPTIPSGPLRHAPVG